MSELAAGLFEWHDRARFEIIGLCAIDDDGGPLRRRIAALFDEFHDVTQLADEPLADRIRELQLDILVDLGGHTLGSRNRVLSFRPAPIQVSFLGYPGTLGTDWVDYIIADRQVIPVEERAHYAENIIFLPNSYLPNDFPISLPPAPSRVSVGLPSQGVVFCAFNAPFKFTPDMFARWMHALQAVPESVLWLRGGTDVLNGNLRQEAARYGINPVRLVFAPRLADKSDYLARFSLADLYLDTSPYNAHTTAAEALAAGVPVITLRGRSFASRVATSLLHAVGLQQLSTSTGEAYQHLAIELGRSTSAIAALKAQLRVARVHAPLFDGPRYCRDLERGLLEAAGRYLRGRAPADITVCAA